MMFIDGLCIFKGAREQNSKRGQKKANNFPKDHNVRWKINVLLLMYVFLDSVNTFIIFLSWEYLIEIDLQYCLHVSKEGICVSCVIYSTS